MTSHDLSKKSLTVTYLIRTIKDGIRNGENVDESLKAIVEKLMDLEAERDRINDDILTIRRTLSLAGIDSPLRRMGDFQTERGYKKSRPFAGMALKDACLRVLIDGLGEWFTKSQVEYMLSLGGYESDAKDPSNSVDITLRKLAELDACEVIRQRGVLGNKYRVPKKESNDLNSRATKK